MSPPSYHSYRSNRQNTDKTIRLSNTNLRKMSAPVGSDVIWSSNPARSYVRDGQHFLEYISELTEASTLKDGPLEQSFQQNLNPQAPLGALKKVKIETRRAGQ